MIDRITAHNLWVSFAFPVDLPISRPRVSIYCTPRYEVLAWP